MAYTIHLIGRDGRINEHAEDGGYTRCQVQTALANHGLLGLCDRLPKLPRFGKQVVVAMPIPTRSFAIKHV